jgi:hypothetical protein
MQPLRTLMRKIDSRKMRKYRHQKQQCRFRRNNRISDSEAQERFVPKQLKMLKKKT